MDVKSLHFQSVVCPQDEDFSPPDYGLSVHSGWFTSGNWWLGCLIVQTLPRHSGRECWNPGARDGKSRGGWTI